MTHSFSISLFNSGILPAIDLLGWHALVGVSFYIYVSKFTFKALLSRVFHLSSYSYYFGISTIINYSQYTFLDPYDRIS